MQDLHRLLLDEHAKPYRSETHRTTRLFELTGLSGTRQAQEINRLINTREALEHDPVTTNRLRRIRDQRQRSRSVR